MSLTITNINPTQICSVKKLFKKEYNNIKWEPASKGWLGLFNQKEGFYDKWHDMFWETEENLLKFLADDNNTEVFIENKQLFVYPRLKISMSNKDVFYITFKTDEELIEYTDEFVNKYSFIENFD